MTGLEYEYPSPLAERNPLRASHRFILYVYVRPEVHAPEESMHILYEFFGRGETAVINTYLV